MPKIISSLIVLLTFLSGAAWGQKNYTLNFESSGITWKIGVTGSSHNGTIGIKGGQIYHDGNKITSAKFLIDMSTIKDLDLSKEKQPEIEEHIKSEDFFDVNKFPYATFSLDNLYTHEDGITMVYGKMTIKGITNSISFPVRIKESGNQIYITAKDIVIKRADYGIEIKNKGLKGKMEEMVINDDFKVSFSITMKGFN